MIGVPFTTFDQAIKNNLESIFLELVKIYKKNDSFCFHFIGFSEFINLSDIDLADFPESIKKFHHELLYLSQQEKFETITKKQLNYILENNFDFEKNYSYNHPNIGLIDEDKTVTALEKEFNNLSDFTFEKGLDFSKHTIPSKEDLGKEIWYKLHFPATLANSTYCYEFFEEELIISNCAYVIHSSEYDWNTCDFILEDWVPNALLSKFKDTHKVPTKLLCFINRKLYYFELNLEHHIQKTKEQVGLKSKKKTIKYLIEYFQKIIDAPLMKITILEGIKFPISITNLYLSTLISFLQKKYHQKKGNLLTKKFLLAQPLFIGENNYLKKIESITNQLTSYQTQKDAFYFPNKLFWDTQKNGDLKNIFYELNNPKYLYKGKKYMEIEDIDQFIDRNFTFDEHLKILPKNQISLPFNSFIGPIRQFLYSFRYRYYQDFQGELFAQMLRDNFYDFYRKKGMNLSFPTLKKIASNMHKGSHKINIKLPDLGKK